MKMLTVESGYHRVAHAISDDTKADAAYAKIKAALEAHREYGNDKDKTVSIETDTGEITFRLGSAIGGGLAAVEIEALDDRMEAVVREFNAWKKRFKDKDVAEESSSTL